MALTSSSTLSDVMAAFENNCDYDMPADVTKARAFVVACRFMLRRVASEVAHGSQRIRESPEQIKAMMEKAERFLSANDAGAASSGGVRYFSFNNSR